MLPKQQGYEPTQRFRRRNNGGSNASRIVIALVIGIGLVIVSLILANTYDFNSGDDPQQPDSSSSATNARSDSGTGVSSPGDENVSSSSGGGSNGPVADSSAGASGGQPGDAAGSSGSIGDPGSSAGVASSGNGKLTGSGDTEESRHGEPGDEPIVIASNTSCTIHGRVTDDWGSSMVGVLVRAVTADGTTLETLTDTRGRYALAGAMPELDPNANAGAELNTVDVSVILSHGKGASSSFAVMNGDAVIALTAPVSRPAASDTNGCEQNFDTWNIQDTMVAAPVDTALWPDAVAIYQYIHNAEDLALSLGADLDNATTLQVQVWCDDPALGCDPSRNGAFFVAENELGEGSPPIIAMMPDRSSAKSSGVPDNREYHEYGHYFLWLQTGETFELPASDRNHGGYYRNTSTRDSFVEGFAEFYSMMVSARIDGDIQSEIYTIGGDYDLEADRLPWEAEGWWEEFTVAGLLLDLVDTDADYAARASGPPGVNVLEVTVNAEPSGTIVVGKVVNTSPLVVRNADVTVRYMNDEGVVIGTQVTKIIPEIIAPTREGIFFAAPPAGLDVTTATATLGGIARPDDDDVALDLRQLIGIITGDGQGSAGGNAGVSDIAELYDALSGRIDSLSAAGGEVSSAQIDQIFINHGFFADIDGDQKYDPDIDGEIGLSSHPVVQVGDTFYPAVFPRRDPGAYGGSFVSINTGDASVDAVIQISVPANGGWASYAYVTKLSGQDRVELAVPASGQDAEVTIITAGKGFKPVIAFRVDADEFHERVKNGTISELQIAPVELAPGTSLSPAGEDGSTIELKFIIGAIIAALFVVASLVVIGRKWGRA